MCQVKKCIIVLLSQIAEPALAGVADELIQLDYTSSYGLDKSVRTGSAPRVWSSFESVSAEHPSPVSLSTRMSFIAMNGRYCVRLSQYY